LVVLLFIRQGFSQKELAFWASVCATGDKVIIIACFQMSAEKAKDVQIKKVFIDEKNKPRE